jgi:hypothetical protein
VRILELPLLGGVYPYTYTAVSTTMDPTTKAVLMSMSLKKYSDTKLEMMIDRDVANPFNTLSAYFTTTATI